MKHYHPSTPIIHTHTQQVVRYRWTKSIQTLMISHTGRHVDRVTTACFYTQSTRNYTFHALATNNTDHQQPPLTAMVEVSQRRSISWLVCTKGCIDMIQSGSSTGVLSVGNLLILLWTWQEPGCCVFYWSSSGVQEMWKTHYRRCRAIFLPFQADI